jgi:uncharacterized protein YjbJ (UPF0337 family)
MLKNNEVKGKARQIKGGLKQKVGEITGNPDLQDEGQVERIEGKIQQKVGQAQSKVDKALRKVKKATSD